MFKSTPHTSAPPRDVAKAMKALAFALQTATTLQAELKSAGLQEETHLLDAFLCSVEQRLDALSAGAAGNR